MQAAKAEVAQQVREAIAHVPPLQGTTLEVDEQNIYASSVSNQRWWRVPLTPYPYPVRLSPLYEVMAEIEEHLRDEQHNDIILFVGDFAEQP